MTAFRFAGGSSLVRSSASAASRAATSRSPFFAWNNSLVMSSAARIAALCVSTMGPCDNTFFSAWSTYAATSRVYSGGRSDRTVYSSPPIITLTACFLVLTGPLRRHPERFPPPTRPPPAGPRAHSAVAAGFPRLLFEKRQAREEIVDPPPRRLDPLAQRLVLLLQVRHAVPRLGVGLGGGPAPPTTLLQLGFGLDGARATPPARPPRGEGWSRAGRAPAHQLSLRRTPSSPSSATSPRANSASTSRSRSVRSGSRNEQCQATPRCPPGMPGPRYSSNTSSRSSSGPTVRRKTSETWAAVTPGGSTSAKSRSTGGCSGSGRYATRSRSPASSRTSKPNNGAAQTGASASRGPAQPTTPPPRCTATQPTSPPVAASPVP